MTAHTSARKLAGRLRRLRAEFESIELFFDKSIGVVTDNAGPAKVIDGSAGYSEPLPP